MSGPPRKAALELMSQEMTAFNPSHISLITICAADSQELNDPPSPIASPAGQLPWKRSSQLQQHQVHGLGRHLQELRRPEAPSPEGATGIGPRDRGDLELLRHLSATRFISSRARINRSRSLLAISTASSSTWQKPCSFSRIPSLPCGRIFDFLNPAASGRK